MKRLSCLFILIILLNIIGCVPPNSIQTYYNADNFQITSLNDKKVKVGVANNVDLRNFTYTFNKEYATNEKFIEEFKHKLKTQLSSLVSLTEGDSGEIAFLIAPNFGTESIEKTKEIFEKSKEDFFLIVKNVNIDSKVLSRTRPPISLGSGQQIGGGTDYSEDCIVKIYVEIWDIKEKRKISDFSATGVSSVFLFFYADSLKKAIDRSIENLAIYIKGQ